MMGRRAAPFIKIKKGSPQKRSSAFVGGGGARKCVKLSPQAEAELNGLCPDDVGNDGNVTKFIILHKI